MNSLLLKIISTIGILTLTACDSANSRVQTEQVLDERTQNLVRNWDYVRDPRTKLCYLVHNQDGYIPPVLVPCESIPQFKKVVSEK